jgi:hypothetical protein
MIDHDCCSCVEALKAEIARLLAELAAQAAEQRWQGRSHVSPVPHLAGVAYGLLGPAMAEELQYGSQS